uniref:Integrase zinc-binding domain-containing protein n=1 Tax=Ascaris lumbricoides TaxID=6252 RepID=A0A9J2Q3V7_ASCLU
MERRSCDAPPIDDDGYGGMELEIYDAIVHFKKTGEYPPFADQRLNRNAHFHWRLRCQNFVLADNDTLLYCNPNCQVDSVSGPRIVVKKGEARTAVKIVHERIGHAGQKQTHMAVAKRLYWRSIRRDTIRFVFECEICQKKRAIRNRAKESQTLPDSVELYMTSDAPPLDASEVLVAERLLLNEPINYLEAMADDVKNFQRISQRRVKLYMTSDAPPLDASEVLVAERLLLNEPINYLEAMADDVKNFQRISQRRVYEYVDEDDIDEFGEMMEELDEESVDVYEYVDEDDIDEFGEMMEELDEESVDVIHNEDYLQYAFNATVGKEGATVEQRNDGTIDPVKRSPSPAPKRYRLALPIDGRVGAHLHQPVVTVPNRVMKRSAAITGTHEHSSETLTNQGHSGVDDAVDVDGVPVSQREAHMVPHSNARSPVDSSIKVQPAGDETTVDSGLARRFPCSSSGVQPVSPSIFHGYASRPSTSAYDRSASMTGIRTRPGMNHYVKRKAARYVTQHSPPDEMVTGSSLGAVGTVVSGDRELLRLQKQVLLLQRQVYMMKKQYLQMKIDNFLYCHQSSNVYMMGRLDDEIVSSDDTLTVAGNEEVRAEGSSICIER